MEEEYEFVNLVIAVMSVFIVTMAIHACIRRGNVKFPLARVKSAPNVILGASAMLYCAAAVVGQYAAEYSVSFIILANLFTIAAHYFIGYSAISEVWDYFQSTGIPWVIPSEEGRSRQEDNIPKWVYAINVSVLAFVDVLSTFTIGYMKKQDKYAPLPYYLVNIGLIVVQLGYIYKRIVRLPGDERRKAVRVTAAGYIHYFLTFVIAEEMIPRYPPREQPLYVGILAIQAFLTLVSMGILAPISGTVVLAQEALV